MPRAYFLMSVVSSGISGVSLSVLEWSMVADIKGEQGTTVCLVSLSVVRVGSSGVTVVSVVDNTWGLLLARPRVQSVEIEKKILPFISYLGLFQC